MLVEQQGFETLERRELGKEDDLQEGIDRNQQFEDKQLHDKILFAVQGLGSIRTIKQGDKYIDAYIKGPHCQDSIKDLVKFIRTDVADNPKVKLILSEYNIVETDLIELLLLQVEDKKLSFWIIALLALMTAKPSQQLIEDDKERLFKALREYKRSFVKHECLTILTIHIADYFRTQDKQKAHFQMLEFIILLLRNLLQIPDQKSQDQSLHNHFLATLIREEMFNPLLYLIQNQKGPIMDKIDIPLLQIFFYSFTCFEPQTIYKPKNTINFIRMANKNKIQRGAAPVRHSRFLPHFMHKSEVGITRITHKLNENNQPILNQKKIPRRTAELKKVEKIEQNSFPENFMEIEFEVHDSENGGNLMRKIGQVVFELCQQFAQVQFPQLSELVFSQIYKQNSKVSSQNVIQYLLLCNWAIKMTRAKYIQQKSQAKNQVEAEQVEFDLGQIANVMQTAHFELIYKTLFKEATREKKKQFQVNIFNSALTLFENYLNVINDISLTFRPSDRNNANILMANMFRHDIARIFKIGFTQITHEGILKTLISVCHKFYKLLSKYSNGKVLTIQTNKLLKRKNKKKMQDDEENIQDFISQDSEGDSDGERSYRDGEQRDGKKETKIKEKAKPQRQIQHEDEPMFQQRKFNEISEFAIIAEYEIISKYLIFLKGDKILSNSDDFNDSLFYYFEQISKLLKGEWLFYQVETLVVFKEILCLSGELMKKNREKYTGKIKFVKGVCKEFIKLLQKNKLALIESLFNYPNLSLKERILKNYEDGEYDGGEEMQKNMFIDQDDEK